MLSNDAAIQDSLSAGALLRNAREAAGLHIAALAVAIKIPVKKLEALESDRLDLLPDAVFVRALASSVCRSLKIDSAPILAKLPQNITPKLKSDELGINAPFHASNHTQGIGFSGFLAKPVVLTVAALVIGAIVLAVIPSNRETDGDMSGMAGLQEPSSMGVTEPASAVLPESSSAVVLPMTGATPLENVTTIVAAPAVDQPLPSNVAKSDPASLVKSAEVNATDSVETRGVAPLAAEAKGVVSNANILTLAARGASWVEVVDAKGTVQLRKTLTAGERAVVSGSMPLSVVIGKVDVIDVDVGGKPFNLSGIAKDNVARFEVK